MTVSFLLDDPIFNVTIFLQRFSETLNDLHLKIYSFIHIFLFPEVHVDIVGPVSGCFEGKFYHKTVGQATLELKIDVDQIKEHSPVLNVVSGSIVKTKGEFLRYVGLGRNFRVLPVPVLRNRARK